MFYIYSNGNNSKALDEPVHERFVKMVKCAFAKMAGAGLMDPELINRDFWRWFPTKMNNSKNYLKRAKKVKKKNNSIYCVLSYPAILCFQKSAEKSASKRKSPSKCSSPAKRKKRSTAKSCTESPLAKSSASSSAKSSSSKSSASSSAKSSASSSAKSASVTSAKNSAKNSTSAKKKTAAKTSSASSAAKKSTASSTAKKLSAAYKSGQLLSSGQQKDRVGRFHDYLAENGISSKMRKDKR